MKKYYLIDEADYVDKGWNTTVSMLEHNIVKEEPQEY